MSGASTPSPVDNADPIPGDNIGPVTGDRPGSPRYETAFGPVTGEPSDIVQTFVGNLQFTDVVPGDGEIFRLPPPRVPNPAGDRPTTPQGTRPEVQVRVIPVPALKTNRMIIRIDDVDSTAEYCTIPTEQVDTADLAEENQNCSICLNLFGTIPESHMEHRSGEYPVRLQCGHMFGEECINNWICTGNYTCPLCRTNWLALNQLGEGDTTMPDIVLRQNESPESGSVQERLISLAMEIHNIHNNLAHSDVHGLHRMNLFREAQRLHVAMRIALMEVFPFDSRPRGFIEHLVIIGVSDHAATAIIRRRRLSVRSDSETSSESGDESDGDGEPLHDDLAITLDSNEDSESTNNETETENLDSDGDGAPLPVEPEIEDADIEWEAEEID